MQCRRRRHDVLGGHAPQLATVLDIQGVQILVAARDDTTACRRRRRWSRSDPSGSSRRWWECAARCRCRCGRARLRCLHLRSQLVEIARVGSDIDVLANHFRLRANRFAGVELPAHLAVAADGMQRGPARCRRTAVPLSASRSIPAQAARARIHRPQDLWPRRLPVARAGFSKGAPRLNSTGIVVDRYGVGRQIAAQCLSSWIPRERKRELLGVDRVAGERHRRRAGCHRRRPPGPTAAPPACRPSRRIAARDATTRRPTPDPPTTSRRDRRNARSLVPRREPRVRWQSDMRKRSTSGIS